LKDCLQTDDLEEKPWKSYVRQFLTDPLSKLMLFLLQTENMGKVCIFNVCVLPKGTRENTGHG